MKYNKSKLTMLILGTLLLGCNNSDDNSSSTYQGYRAQVEKPALTDSFRNLVYVSYNKTEQNKPWVDNDDNFGEITDLNIAFMNPSANRDSEGISHPDGIVPSLDHEHEKLLVKTIQTFRDKSANGRVFLSFGGWRDNESGENDDGMTGRDIVYEKIAASPEARENFIESIMKVVNRYDLDGIDLDWEYPRTDDTVAYNYTEFVNMLADRLHEEGLYFTAALINGRGTQTKDKSECGDFYMDEALDVFDTVNLMTYDMRNEDHSSYKDTKTALDYWIHKRHLDPHRVTLGLPSYSHHGPTYTKMVHEQPQMACRDTIEGKDGVTHYYNGLPTIRSKVHLAEDYHLGGVMLWELPCDAIEKGSSDLSIIKTIDATINQDRSYQNVCDKHEDWIVYRKDDPMPHFDS